MEDAIDVLARRRVRLCDVGVGVAAQHLVDGADDVQHLLLADEPVAVQVVQPEDPLQLVLHRAPRYVGQDRQELLRQMLRQMQSRLLVTVGAWGR